MKEVVLTVVIVFFFVWVSVIAFGNYLQNEQIKELNNRVEVLEKE